MGKPLSSTCCPAYSGFEMDWCRELAPRARGAWQRRCQYPHPKPITLHATLARGRRNASLNAADGGLEVTPTRRRRTCDASSGGVHEFHHKTHSTITRLFDRYFRRQAVCLVCSAAGARYAVINIDDAKSVILVAIARARMERSRFGRDGGDIEPVGQRLTHGDKTCVLASCKTYQKRLNSSAGFQADNVLLQRSLVIACAGTRACV